MAPSAVWRNFMLGALPRFIGRAQPSANANKAGMVMKAMAAKSSTNNPYRSQIRFIGPM